MGDENLTERPIGPTLSTEHLVMRPLETADAEALARAIFGDPDIGWRYGLVADTSSPERQRQTALEWIEDSSAHWRARNWGAWALRLRRPEDPASEDLVGFCGFFSADAPVPDHELGYGIAKPHWGRGFATEAAIASLRFIFTVPGVDRVETVAHPVDNLGSSRVLEKAGLRWLGHIDYCGSVAAGVGLFNHFGVDRADWLRRGL